MNIKKFNEKYYTQVKLNTEFLYNAGIPLSIICNKFSFVVEESEKVIGYIYAEKIENKNSILLYALEIVPSERRKGIGKKLEKYFEDQCRNYGIGEILLFYSESESLNSFYNSLDFEGIGANIKTLVKEL